MCEWHSVKLEGYPPDEQLCTVTIAYGNIRICDGPFMHLSDVSPLVDKRTKSGKQYIAEHPDGVWRACNDDGYFETVEENSYEYAKVIAWMPEPLPYDGE